MERGRDLGIVLRLLICIFVFGVCLYFYIDKQNELMQIRIAIPEVRKEIKQIREESTRIQYAIDQFENPQHLIELSRQKAYAHLKHPLAKEIVTLNEAAALETPTKQLHKDIEVRAKPTLAVQQ